MNDLAGNEIHVVYSARDLGRQLPAAWQESIKQGRKWPFKRFLTKVERGQTWFRNAMDLPAVLANWGAKLPPERVHVVTVPHDRGPNGDELWLRFCRPSASTRRGRRSTPSVTTAPSASPRPRSCASSTAASSSACGASRPTTTSSASCWPRRSSSRARPWPCGCHPTATTSPSSRPTSGSTGSRAAACDVIGDVEDLRPRRPAEGEVWKDPDRVRAKLELGAALDALTVMTREAANRADPTKADRSVARHRPSAARPLTATDPDAPGRAWGWVAHLRGGGTTPWLAWSGTAEPSAGCCPGAQQLELLRRLNLAGRPRRVDALGSPTGCSPPARGRPWPGRPAADRRRRVGVRPPGGGPALLGAHELIRVASVLLAEDLVALGADPLPSRAAPAVATTRPPHRRPAGRRPAP